MPDGSQPRSSGPEDGRLTQPLGCFPDRLLVLRSLLASLQGRPGSWSPCLSVTSAFCPTTPGFHPLAVPSARLQPRLLPTFPRSSQPLPKPPLP